MATTQTDTTGWQVVVPVNPALDLTGSRLTATIADRFGGVVVALDSAVLVTGYGAVHQIDWTADPVTRKTSQLILTVTHAMRGSWLAVGPNGLPGLATLFADIQRTEVGSTRDPDLLGRTSFSVMPGTDSPAVAAALGGFQAILLPLPGTQAISATALTVGPQGARGDPGTVLSTYPVAIAQDGQTVIPYPVQYPPLVPATVHLIVNGEEYFAPDITVGPSAVTWANPAFPLEKTDRVVLRYT
ncbi:hypothetical protein MKK84_27115 [Methylobacterium sp. E-065]|uniref:hypothetical protein n=1 Tax=Methylobacterium sp. E-065 TaxID=2836583 RepID=UPI001FB8C121|nr:hypothetical protein [Methylobacterium sp. E-065]MCJ2021049.1 hypothetical protein [Methylobacterium sp. E-065]